MQGAGSIDGSVATLAAGSAADAHAIDAAGQGRDAEAARAFETLFATMLVREMRKTLPDGIFGPGAGSDVYESWFDQHLGRTLAERDALGLAGMVKTAFGSASTADQANPYEVQR